MWKVTQDTATRVATNVHTVPMPSSLLLRRQISVAMHADGLTGENTTFITLTIVNQVEQLL